MKKTLVMTSLCLGMLLPGTTQAQTASVIPDALLPTVPGAALRPQNAGSSTLQNINYAGATNHLYVHSWDVFSPNTANGIAWRRTDATGTLINDGYLPMNDVNDIDVALYQSGTSYYVLAAYYYNNGTSSSAGHYYDIYRFDPGGLTPISTFNLLTTSANFGRINVDANTPYGLCITWCVPGTGIFVKAANLPYTGFGPTVLLSGTSAFKDPDAAITRYTGNLDMQLVMLSNTNTTIREFRLAFASVVSGSGAMTLEHTATATAGTTLGAPRIDCPDAFSVQKWTYVYAQFAVSGTTVNERIYAAVKNAGWSTTPLLFPVHSTSYSSGYQPNNPVIAYDNSATRIHVGWITRDNTVVIPGTTDAKYVAKYVSDPGSSAPTPIASSYMMISNQPGGPAPVLAFSGQNTQSNFNGLHTAFSQLNISIPGSYSINYKDKPWTSSTFRMNEHAGTALTAMPSVFPNPFSDQVSVVLPVKANYSISLTGIDGRVVYRHTADFDAMEKTTISTTDMVPGIYLLQVRSADATIDYTSKLLK